MQAALLILIGLVLAYNAALSNPRSGSLPYYELIYETDSTLDLTGSITMKCRKSSTAEELDLSETSFFLNHSSVINCLSLRDRGDITLVSVGRTGIKFNLTREYDGYYSCGKRGGDTCNVNYTTSLPKPLVCEWSYRISQFSYNKINKFPPSIQHFKR